MNRLRTRGLPLAVLIAAVAAPIASLLWAAATTPRRGGHGPG